MGLICWRPFRHRPESIHHPSRTVRIFVRKPPLRGKRRMSMARKSLKIRDPVVGAKRRISIADIAGFGEVECLHCGEPGSMAVAALIRLIAAEVVAVALLGCDGRAVHDVLRPFVSCRHPLDKLPCMLAPLRIFFRME